MSPFTNNPTSILLLLSILLCLCLCNEYKLVIDHQQLGMLSIYNNKMNKTKTLNRIAHLQSFYRYCDVGYC